MLKGIALTVKGWFRGQAEAATDLRYAGREHFHNVRQSIEQVRAQRNEIAGKGIILEDRIATLEKQVAAGIDAVKHWASIGDEDKKLRSYAAYQKDQQQLDKAKVDIKDIQTQVADLDAQILQLENDSEEARNAIDKAATQQVLGKATTKVEDIHKDIKSGPLAGAIDRSKQQAATAEATRRSRTSADNRDLYAFNQGANVLSLDDILGNNTVSEGQGRGEAASTHVSGSSPSDAGNSSSDTSTSFSND